jgi:hypothetical protein
MIDLLSKILQHILNRKSPTVRRYGYRIVRGSYWITLPVLQACHGKVLGGFKVLELCKLQ